MAILTWSIEDSTRNDEYGRFAPKTVRSIRIRRFRGVHPGCIRDLAFLVPTGRAAEYRDNETGFHVIRMSHYSQLIGLEAGLSEEQAELLLHASPMHDVGKTGIPDNVLLKPGKLDDSEWEVMKQHPTIGGQIIGQHSSEILDMARMIALTHHEKWDGSGYPRGLKGDEIPLMCRIIPIADVFDALTSERPYKKPWTVEDTLDHMKSLNGSHFDPALVDAFIEVLPGILKIKSEYVD